MFGRRRKKLHALEDEVRDLGARIRAEANLQAERDFDRELRCNTLEARIELLTTAVRTLEAQVQKLR